MGFINHFIAINTKDIFAKTAKPSLRSKQFMAIRNTSWTYSKFLIFLHKISIFILLYLLFMLINWLQATFPFMSSSETFLTKFIITFKTSLLLVIFVPKHWFGAFRAWILLAVVVVILWFLEFTLQVNIVTENINYIGKVN